MQNYTEMASKALLLSVFASFVLSVYSSAPCRLELSVPSYPPFIMHYNELSGTEFYASKDGIVTVEHGGNVLLTCGDNYLKKYDRTHSIKAVCEDGKLVSSGSVVKFKDLTCDLHVVDEAEHAVDGCSGKNSHGLYYLYHDTQTQKYYKFADVCYDYVAKRVLFVRTVADKDRAPRMTLPDKHVQLGLNSRSKVALITSHRMDKVTRNLKIIIGDEWNGAHEVEVVKILPKIWFNSQIERLSTFPTNNLIMWKVVVDGNWRRLIKDVKNVFNRNSSVEITMGTEGEVSFQGKTIYLDDGNTLPMPFKIWMVINDKEHNKGVAITMINDPFIDTVPIELTGPNLCKDLQWLSELKKNKNYKRIGYGLTFCTTLNNFNSFKVENSAKYGEGSLINDIVVN